MNLKELVAISGKPSIYKIIARSAKGYVVEALDENKKRFSISSAQQVAVLEEITVYVQGEETIPLKEVFSKMKNSELPLPDLKSSSEVLKSYFNNTVPENDDEKVYVSDIKKIIKWFMAIEEFMPEILKEIDSNDENKTEENIKEEGIDE